MANLESGKRLADRYLLQERLGDGGHAEVWAAQDTRTGRRVALKFLHSASCPAEDCWHVLQHEAAMAQRLDHPGVLRMQAPECDGEQVFLPMECAAGGDVRALRGAPWGQVLPVLLQVAVILEHAHSRGVVHRDIKPGNVLFSGDGAVRVTDFGAAARTGSTLALADGSPFSASPQQLAGQPATTADDIYGLGALAYELLSRYPPYYPDIDLRRIREEMPAPLAPAHPAPPQLLAFILSMLEREPDRRPDLRQVIDFFTQSMRSEADAGDSSALIVVSESQPDNQAPAPVQSAHRIRYAAVGLAIAAAAALAAFIFIPARFTAARVVPTVTPPSATPPSTTQLPASPVPAPVPVLATLAQELAAGNTALQAIQPAAARAAFERAVLREPDNAAALAGIAASEKLAKVLDAYTAATRAETAGNLNDARQNYALALKLNRNFAPAQAGIARVDAADRAQAFNAALAQGAAALAAGRVDAAAELYQRAAALGGPQSQVREGQARIAQIRRSDRNARDLAAGAEIEGKEQWSQAVDHYRAVLARDGELRFATDGLARSTRRFELQRELQDFLDRPERLIAPTVRAAATRALARGAATTGPTAGLAAQMQQLRQRLDALAVKVRVEISSDNSTQVFVASVGELGLFARKELELAPGQYTVIGRREGYRDVRRELTIMPGQQPTVVTVQCSERI
jgi:serine/threonine protein kinase